MKVQVGDTVTINGLKRMKVDIFSGNGKRVHGRGPKSMYSIQLGAPPSSIA